MGALTQMIQLSHILRSLSAASNHLSLSLDRVTGMSSLVSQSTSLPAGSATPLNDDSLGQEQSGETMESRGGDQDVTHDGVIDLDDEVD